MPWAFSAWDYLPDEQGPTEAYLAQQRGFIELGHVPDDGSYVRTYYQVPARIGGRIKFRRQHGVIVGFEGQYLLAKLDEEPELQAHEAGEGGEAVLVQGRGAGLDLRPGVVGGAEAHDPALAGGEERLLRHGNILPVAYAELPGAVGAKRKERRHRWIVVMRQPPGILVGSEPYEISVCFAVVEAIFGQVAATR